MVDGSIAATGQQPDRRAVDGRVRGAGRAAAGIYRSKPEQRDGTRVEVRTPAWPHLFRHGAATTILEDADDDAGFVRDQLDHRTIRETLRDAALSEAKRREKAARVRIAPETWA
jgi:integrase